MVGIGLSGYSLKLIGCQHHDLVQRVQQIRGLIEQTIAKGDLAEAFVRARSELGQLRDQMESHFLLEAMGGYLEEAVARLPRLAHEAMLLEHQHVQLIAEVESLMELAAESPISAASWRQLGERYAAFAQRMLDHEAAEGRVLQEGFNEDAAVFE